MNVYLPDELYSEIDEEARRTGSSKGKIARERLVRRPGAVNGDAIADLFGIADDLPADLSSRPDTEFPEYGSDRPR